MWQLVLLYLVKLALGSGGILNPIELDYVCFPNGTVATLLPSVYSHCFAVQDQGTPSAVICSVTDYPPYAFDNIPFTVSVITGCSQDNPIVAFLTNRIGSVDTFGTNDYLSFEIECNQIADSGVTRDITDLLGVTLEVTTQDAVTPSFAISSALREPDQLGSPVYEELVGAEIYWTIDIPSDYSASPTCYAYSGSDASGTPSKLLVLDGCNQDPDILGGNFDAVDTSIPLIKRYYVNLYVFKFYNSDDVFFKCTVKLCPSGSSACDISCGARRRRNAIEQELKDDEKLFTIANVMHIVPASSAASLFGSVWVCIALCFAVNRS